MKHESVLQFPVITEKTAIAEQKGIYVFKVAPTTNKFEVKQAVEKIFNTKVTQVRIINTQEKTKRRGRISGVVAGYKKAIVTLEKGKTIRTKAEEPKVKVKTVKKKAEDTHDHDHEGHNHTHEA